MTYTWIVFLVLAAVATPEIPHEALALIRVPNNGRPAIAAPGAAFGAVLTEKAELRLVRGEVAAELAASWSEDAGGRWHAECTVPDNIPPGRYAIEAVTTDGVHRNVRSVFVREEFPAVYSFAHVTDAHVGANGGLPSAKDTLRAVIEAINMGEAEFVLITGGLTEHGTVDEFNDFIEVLDICEKPTFVCGGERDGLGTLYEDVFEADLYMFRFGKDGYLAFDSKEPVGSNALGGQDGDLEVFRRALKPCRWTIGFTHRYGPSLEEPDIGMRSQLVLFVDNPLDLLAFGHWERGNTEEEACVPWKTTPILVTPAARDGAYRIIDVTPKGIVPRPPEYAKAK